MRLILWPQPMSMAQVMCLIAPKGSSRHWPRGSSFFRSNVAQFVRHGLCWRLVLEHEARRGDCYRWLLRLRPDILWFAPLLPLRSLPTHAVAVRARCVRPDLGGMRMLTFNAWSYHMPKGPADVAAGCGRYENLPDDQFAVVPRHLAETYFGSFVGSHTPCYANRSIRLSPIGSRCPCTHGGVGNIRFGPHRDVVRPTGPMGDLRLGLPAQGRQLRGEPANPGRPAHVE